MMSKNKFKVGDEVRILVPPSAVDMFERGSRGTITNVDYFGCNVVAYDNAVCWYKKEELELVKEAAENDVAKELFGYAIRYSGELMVGVVMAKDIKEAKKITSTSFRIDVNSISDTDFTKISFDSDNLCEIYYGG